MFSERSGSYPNGTHRYVKATIISVNREQKTMQISLQISDDQTEMKTINMRDLIVTGGPKLDAAKANPALLGYRGGRHVWDGEKAVRV